MKITDKIEITNEDNMTLMSRYEDNYFDLAIVDPPYGLGKKTTSGGKKRNSNARFENHLWDEEIPKKEFFDELFRVSKNQIIWGGNYMIEHLKNTRCFICWDKEVYIPTMSRIEFAWTSFNKLPVFVKIDNNQNDRIHPTQKPIKLYKFLIDKFLNGGGRILDTHLGSGSIAIACHDYGVELTACEIDKKYFEDTVKRIKNHTSQLKLF